MADIDLERAVAVLALAHRVIDPVEAARVVQAARAGVDLTSELVARVGETTLLAAVARELRLGFVDLTAPDTPWHPDDVLAARLGVQTLRNHHALPVRNTAGQLGVALVNPAAQSDIVAWVRAQAGAEVVPLLAPKHQIDGRLVQLDTAGFADADPGQEPAADPTPTAPAAAVSNPVVEYLDNLLARAAAEGASDVHFLFQADGSLLVRFRVDGQMRRQAVPLRRREAEIIGTLLAKCGDSIDASDRTRPQDGTFHFVAPSGRRIDARLGMLPQSHGPTVVVRLLDPDNINRRLEDMGFSTATLEQMRRVVRAPQGSVLFMGPTGSGKTTTLYALLKELPATEMSIMTAEDPVEYRLPAIGQTQIRTGLGEKSLTFAKALRSILRLDPDVILVGEIRDDETAETAMHAALTGHLVLSTLHAKTAVGVYARLDELSIEPWLAAESVSLAVNQRLVRTVHECATLGPPTETERTVLTRYDLPVLDRVAHPRPGGCGGCHRTGFRGRVAVVEVMEPTEDVRSLVAVRAPQADVVRAATATGYTSILEDAFRHVQAGTVPVMELLRVAGAGAV